MLPHSYLWGHLVQANLIKSQLPTDAHITNLLSTITERLANHFPNSDSVCYMDMWPFSPPLMVVSSPDTASQAVQQQSLRKPSTLMDLFYPITGGPDLIFMNGEQWKKSRGVFNPGFNPSYLVSQVPAIVEEVVISKDILQAAGQQAKVFQLDPVTLNLTLDVIARITFDMSQIDFHNTFANTLLGIFNYITSDFLTNSLLRFRVKCLGYPLETNSTCLRGGTPRAPWCNGIMRMSWTAF